MQALPTEQTVLILGARGRFGLAAARAFADAGWRVLAHMRADGTVPQEVAGDKRIQWLSVDLTDTAALSAAARNATVVVHALNPVYTNRVWTEQVLPMTRASLALCRSLGATLMVPGNIYNFGTSMPSVLTETTPQLPDTVKGRIRTDMELEIANSGVRAIVIRAGDFFGSGKGTWFDQAIVGKLTKGVFTYPGPQDVPTAWAYLPDLARTFAAVAAKRSELSAFEIFHFAGYSLNAKDWMDALQETAEQRGWVAYGAALKYRSMPWPIIRLGAWFNPVWASLLEMHYLWKTPHALLNNKLVALIGAEPHTPLRVAAQTALNDLGMLGHLSPAPDAAMNATAS